MRAILATTLLLLSSALNAQPGLPYFDEAYERVVIPVGEVRQSGAFGTTWRLDAWVFNSTDDRVTLSQGRPVCTIMCSGGRPSVKPGVSRIELFDNIFSNAPNGMFLHFPREHSEDLTFHVRLVLETPDGDRPSVEIPIIRERDFRTAPIVLLDVPNNPDRRVMLRVYEATGERPVAARIRVLPLEGVDAIADRIMFLAPGTAVGDDFPTHTGVAQVPLADLIDLSSAPERLRIEVTASTPEDLPLWAFASITENDTQHVTLITPQ